MAIRFLKVSGPQFCQNSSEGHILAQELLGDLKRKEVIKGQVKELITNYHHYQIQKHFGNSLSQYT